MEKLNLSMPFMVKAFLISARQWEVMKEQIIQEKIAQNQFKLYTLFHNCMLIKNLLLMLISLIFLRCNGRKSCRIDLSSLLVQLFPQNCKDAKTEKYPSSLGLQFEYKCISESGTKKQ